MCIRDRVEAEVILARLPRLEPLPLGVTTEAAVVEVGGQAAGAVGDLGPGQAAPLRDEALPIRLDRGNRLVHLRQAEFHRGRR